MPEVGFAEADKLTKLKIDPLPSQEELLSKIQNDPSLTFVGEGAESIVVTTNSKSEKVMAISYGDLTPEEAKKQFYMQRIFSTLFPHNFPHFYAAFGSDEAKIPYDQEALVSRNSTFTTGTVRERVDKQERRKLGIKEKIWKKLTNNPEIKYSFFDVFWKESIEMQIDPNIILDTEWGGLEKNLEIGQDGGEYYMDKIHTPTWFSQTYRDVILGYMDKKKYSQIQKQTVMTSLDRLSILNQKK